MATFLLAPDYQICYSTG